MRLSPAIRLGRVPLVGSAIVMIALSLACAPDRPLPPSGVRQVANS